MRVLEARRPQLRALVAIKHLSGQHNQQSHGRSGASAVSSSVEDLDAAPEDGMDFISRGLGAEEIWEGKPRSEAKALIQREVGARVAEKATAEQREYLMALGAGMSLEQYRSLPKGFRERHSDYTMATGANKLIDKAMFTWASSSDSGNPDSVALQMAAAKEFGGDISGIRRHLAGEPGGLSTLKQAMTINAEQSDLNRLVLREMYNYTQEEFAKRGVKEVTLFRGVTLDKDTSGWEGGEQVKDVTLRPLSSFSANKQIARDFASEQVDGLTKQVGVTIWGKVPVSRILSTSRTGLGCLPEYEYVLIGKGKTKVKGRVTYPPIGEGYLWT